MKECPPSYGFLNINIKVSLQILPMKKEYILARLYKYKNTWSTIGLWLTLALYIVNGKGLLYKSNTNSLYRKESYHKIYLDM